MRNHREGRGDTHLTNVQARLSPVTNVTGKVTSLHIVFLPLKIHPAYLPTQPSPNLLKNVSWVAAGNKV